MNNIIKSLKASSIIIVLATLIIPVVNYIIGKTIILDYVQTQYILNLIIANTEVTFENISNALTSIVIAKDILVVFTTAIYQIIFLIIFKKLAENKKGVIRFIVVIILHLLSYIGIAISYLFYSNLTVGFDFITIQTYILIFLQAVNSILLTAFIILYIKEKLSNIRPLTTDKIHDAIYFILRTTTVFLIVAFALITINIVVLYNVVLMVISNISFEQLFNLPPTLQYDLLNFFTDLPTGFKVLLTSFEFRHWLFEIVNGQILINIATLSNNIQIKLSSIASTYFDTYFPVIATMLSYYVVLQITNYLHKKLKYNNIIPVLLLVIIIALGTPKVPNIKILYYINNMSIVLVTLYVLLMIDNKLNKYSITNKICDKINNFKLNETIKSFSKQAAVSANELKSHSINVAGKVKVQSIKFASKSKDKANELKDDLKEKAAEKKKNESETKVEKDSLDQSKEKIDEPKEKKKTTTTKKKTSKKS